MKILENLELVNVSYNETGKKATLTFLDEEHGEILEVNFNQQAYEDGKFIDSPEKAAQVEEWSKDFFGLTFDTLSKAIGTRKTVYAYDTFNSLFLTVQIKKFDDDMVGQIIDAVVTEVVDDGVAIRIRFAIADSEDVYESKMTYSEYIETLKKWYVNALKKAKQYAKFEEKFQIPIERKDELVGKNIMVEVKKAMGKWIFSEVKPFAKKKK